MSLCLICDEKERRHGPYCLSCRATYRAQKHLKDRQRDTRMKRVYGIGLSALVHLLKGQKQKCLICVTRLTTPKATPKKTDWVVDHNHKTGLVRGILCRACNSGIGFFDDNPDLVKQAAEYLS